MEFLPPGGSIQNVNEKDGQSQEMDKRAILCPTGMRRSVSIRKPTEKSNGADKVSVYLLLSSEKQRSRPKDVSIVQCIGHADT